MPARIFCIEDARKLARRRLPRIVFDFIDGAAGQELLLSRNQTELERVQLMPRVLVDIESRTLGKTFLGTQWGLPFGVAPMGLCNLVSPDADRLLARAAGRYNIPLGLSTMGSTSIEEMRDLCGGNAWFQLYVGGSEELAWSLVDRCQDCGYDVLVFTVDVPRVAPRVRDLRNGFLGTQKMGARQFLDFATHPLWSVPMLLSGGQPETVNVLDDSGNMNIQRFAGRGWIDWEFLARLRDKWKGALVVKGILSPSDAVRAQQAGVDAICVSSHGGRQLDSAPASITMLPYIRRAVGEGFPLLLDSGVRSGESIIKAIAMGADFVLLGRPFLYGIGAAGESGLYQVIDYLSDDVSHTLAEIGKLSPGDVDKSVLAENNLAP